jgi:hypothetical protein
MQPCQKHVFIYNWRNLNLMAYVLHMIKAKHHGGHEMDNTKDLEKKLAHLEFVNDQLLTEISYVDGLLRLIGFSNGLESIKNAAKEVLEQENIE